MNFRRREPRAIESIPRLSLVAFIDIVLFLLLYLMLAGTLSPPESRLAAGVERPSSSQREAPLAPIRLRVERTGDLVRFKVGQRDIESRDGLVVALSGVPKEGGVLVTAGEGTFVADVASGLQAAKDAGFARVSYAP